MSGMPFNCGLAENAVVNETVVWNYQEKVRLTYQPHFHGLSSSCPRGSERGKIRILISISKSWTFSINVNTVTHAKYAVFFWTNSLAPDWVQER